MRIVFKLKGGMNLGINNIYKTKQKELVIECLKENLDKHLTVEEIYLYLSSKGNKVGLATIYRNLASLVEDGTIKKFNISNVASYQYMHNSDDCNNHYHLKCVKCNKLYHIELPEMAQVNNAIGELNNFCVDTTKTILYGKCKEC